MEAKAPIKTETRSAISVTEETRDIVTLCALIRISIQLAARNDLMATEHELRRALLGVHLEVPEAAALAVAAIRSKPN